MEVQRVPAVEEVLQHVDDVRTWPVEAIILCSRVLQDKSTNVSISVRQVYTKSPRRRLARPHTLKAQMQIGFLPAVTLSEPVKHVSLPASPNKIELLLQPTLSKTAA